MPSYNAYKYNNISIFKFSISFFSNVISDSNMLSVFPNSAQRLFISAVNLFYYLFKKQNIKKKN